MFKLNDSFFKKVENKTNVDKDTIMSLAEKVQKGNMKDEKTLREVVREISKMTGKDVSEEKENKIINTILEDNVSKDLDNML
ncbi:MAG TPA: stage VI sporulation protein F [Bacilli bacterium]|nr:stage VI sporulation protein F [Bacilli bacterium]